MNHNLTSKGPQVGNGTNDIFFISGSSTHDLADKVNTFLQAHENYYVESNPLPYTDSTTGESRLLLMLTRIKTYKP